MPVSNQQLYTDLCNRADGELLIAWSVDLPAIGSPAVAELTGSGSLFTYRAGKPRRPYAYLVDLYRPGDDPGPGSIHPAPSIQAGSTWVMYARRDRHTCHLCGGLVVSNWRQPHGFHSLDHLVPRSKGGRDWPSNVRLSHASCNKGRRARDVAEFRAWLAANRPGRALIAGAA